MLITFEGGDGSGKSTHTALFCDYLKSKNIDYILTREPGGTNFSEAVRALVKSEKYADKSDLSELFLFEAARADITEKVIVSALKAGKMVILDRFYDSTVAYQGYGRGIDIEAINMLNRLATRGLEPDITFYLRIAPEKAFARKGGREKGDNMEAAGADFYDRVLMGFDEIARSNPKRFVTLDTTQEISAVSNEINTVFDKKYKERFSINDLQR